jgi:NADPH2:quinone reductase
MPRIPRLSTIDCVKAIVVERYVLPSELSVKEITEPGCGDGEVLIEVRAAGCNFFDTLIVQGKYQVKPPFPFSPGGEVAGRVRRVGAGVDGIAVGDDVMARVGYGGFAELCAAPARSAVRLPPGTSFVDGAALPIAYGTAYAAVVLRGRCAAGETVLVTAAAGGVGLASIQIVKAIGARVIAAASADTLEVARRVGADLVVDYQKEDWADAVKEATSGRGADVIIENVGGDVFDSCTRCIAWGGRLVISGFSSGRIPEVKLNRVLLKHIALVGLHFGPMSEHEPATVARAYDEILRLYDEGRVAPVIFATFPLENAADALAALASRDTFGKVVLIPA